MIRVVATGEDETRAAFQRIDRLYEPARFCASPELSFARIDGLHAAARWAVKAGALARREGRDAELSQLTSQKREENAGLTQYERDIRVMKG